jgi:hypothetical protein
MMDPTWTDNDVVTLIEKGTQLIVQLIKTFKTPDRTFRGVTDLTQRLKARETEIDHELDDIYQGEDV